MEVEPETQWPNISGMREPNSFGEPHFGSGMVASVLVSGSGSISRCVHPHHIGVFDPTPNRLGVDGVQN